jgi:hypothetical protein
MRPTLNFVMPGLVPGIHVFLPASKTWMAGTSPDKPRHDVDGVSIPNIS